MALIKLCLEPKILKCSLSWICPVLSYVLEQVSDATLSDKKYKQNLITYNCKSEISNVFNSAQGHCLKATKIVNHHVNDCFV